MRKPREKKSLTNGQLPADGLGVWVQVGKTAPLYVAIAGVPLYQREEALTLAFGAVLAGLRGPVDSFFDGVLVNADDTALRNNRLNLLQTLRAEFLRVADISQLAITR